MQHTLFFKPQWWPIWTDQERFITKNIHFWIMFQNKKTCPQTEVTLRFQKSSQSLNSKSGWTLNNINRANYHKLIKCVYIFQSFNNLTHPLLLTGVTWSWSLHSVTGWRDRLWWGATPGKAPGLWLMLWIKETYKHSAVLYLQYPKDTKAISVYVPLWNVNTKYSNH